MAQMGVSVVLEARDNASGILDQFGKTVIDLSDKSERGLVRVETAMARTARATRQMAIPLVSELIPAMDSTLARMASVVAGAATLGTGLGALALAGAGLAGVIGGTLFNAWQKWRTETEQTQRALASMDVGRISREIAELERKVEDAAAALAKLREQSAGSPSIGDFTAQALTDRSQRAVQDALRTFLDAQRALETARHGEAEVASFGALALESGPARVALELAAREADIARRVRRLQGEESVSFGLLVEPSAARSAEITARREAGIATAIARHQGEEDVTFDLAQPQGLNERLRAESSLLEMSRDRLALEQERLAILGQAPGLSIREHEAMEAALGVARERVALQQVELAAQTRIAAVRARTDLTPEQATEQEAEIQRLGALAKANVTLAEAMQSAARARVRFEREDLSGGLLAGIRTIEDEIGGVGTSMQRIFTESARASYQALREQLLAPFERDLRKLPGFVQTIFRTTMEELTKQLVIRPLLGSLQQFLQPGGAGGYPLGSTVNFTGAGSDLVGNGYSLTAGTGGGGRSGIEYVHPSGAPATLADVRLAYAGATFADPSLDPFLDTLYGGRYATAAVGVPSGGSFWNTPIYDTRAASPYFGSGYQAPSAGLTYGQAATYGLSAAGAGLAAYGIYQGAAGGYNTSYLQAGITGGVTGALAGAALGALYGSVVPGLGTAIGAVAGLAIGLLGANVSQGKYKKQHARQQRARDSARIAEGIAAALADAEVASIQEVLQRRLVSGNTVGGVLLGMARFLGETELANSLLDYGARIEGFNYEALNSIDELVANLRGGARQLVDAALAMFQREIERERGILIGREEVVTQAGTRATVQTIVPFPRREELGRGDRFLLQQPGQSDAELERILWRLVDLADRRDIRVFRQDEGGLVVSGTLRA